MTASTPDRGPHRNAAKWTVLGLLLLVLALIIREHNTPHPQQLHTTTAGRIDMCLGCHQQEQPGAAHAPQVVGCAACHLGDALAVKKEKAHAGMVNNPGDLRVVEKTCGVAGCHFGDVKKVKNSLMATNRGIIATLLYYWGEEPDQNSDHSVEQLLHSGANSLALDYYRKLCATCHLWKEKGVPKDWPEFIRAKGGGCTACHAAKPQEERRPDGGKPHPLITKQVPMGNCIRCHNRSGRIGLSYTGRYEAEGYGTPYAAGGLSKQRFADGRFYLNLPADIHYQKKMTCIDCHTRREIMGDGNRYAHYEEQLEINCRTCHTRELPGRTGKEGALNNILEADGAMVLRSKIDQALHPLHPPKQGACDFPGHSRLSCEACHSGWVPQCYGCHVKQDRSETDRDKLNWQQTRGWWHEGRSYIRYEKPMLAVWDNEVVVVTPGCQDIVTMIDEQGNPDRRFQSLTVAAINPHTTQRQGRSCVDCHTSTKTVGLGEGTISRDADGGWHFTPLHQGVTTADGTTTPPLDAFVDINGKPLQRASRPDLRPFSKEELQRILRVGLCLECHDGSAPFFRHYGPKTVCRKSPGDAIKAR